jgi:hypothetical protein
MLAANVGIRDESSEKSDRNATFQCRLVRALTVKNMGRSFV